MSEGSADDGSACAVEVPLFRLASTTPPVTTRSTPRTAAVTTAHRRERPGLSAGAASPNASGAVAYGSYGWPGGG